MARLGDLVWESWVMSLVGRWIAMDGRSGVDIHLEVGLEEVYKFQSDDLPLVRDPPWLLVSNLRWYVCTVITSRCTSCQRARSHGQEELNKRLSNNVSAVVFNNDVPSL